MSSQSGTVGQILGIKLPLLQEQEAGAKQAAATYCKGGSGVHTTYVGSFTEPAKGKQAALAQIGQGADVLFDNADASGEGAIEAAQSNSSQVRYVGYISNVQETAPSVGVTSVLVDFTKGFTELGDLFKSGKLQPKVYEQNVQNGQL